jgi:phosphoenolpyruvate mutase
MKEKIKKTVYVPLAVDYLHSGHINILKKASSYGKVIVGLLTDKAIAEYKKIPLISYDERYQILSGIKFVDRIVKQDQANYQSVIKKYKPSYFAHGDNWKRGSLKKTRSQVFKYMKDVGGKVLEFKYTKNISSSEIKEKINQNLKTTDRVSLLKRSIMNYKNIRLLESHSALTGMIIEDLKVKKGNSIFEFHGMWSSSLTDSLLLGMPDNQSVDYSTRINNLVKLIKKTTKPILFDGDNGGEKHLLPYLIKDLEFHGISGICIEDKKGEKINSLFQNQSKSKQESIRNFCEKIKLICKCRKNKDFYIVARIESLILGKKLSDALTRAFAYVRAGADAILIHSKDKNPKNIILFAKKFKKKYPKVPVICVPSTYSGTFEKKLFESGVNVVVYANQLLRASYYAMIKTAKKILLKQRALESEKQITKIKDIISLIK